MSMSPSDLAESSGIDRIPSTAAAPSASSSERRRTGRRLTLLLGAVLIVGSPAVWFAAGAPGAPTTVFAASVDATDGARGPASSPAPTSPSPAAAPPAAPSGVEGIAPDEPAGAQAPPFTSTAPRGPVDRSLWPTGLAIPALGVRAPVESVGIGAGRALIIPASPMDVGWFQGGAVPGEPGVALLTSHIDTRAEGRGVLSGLVRLGEGDEIEVTTADGSVQRWSVIARTQHAKVDLPPELFSLSGTPVLALVTCGGPFDSTARSYRDNVIVWAEPKD